MTDAQLQAYVPSLAMMLLIALGFLYNNSRLSDLNLGLNKRIDDLRQDTLGRLDRLENHVANLERVTVGKLGEVEARLDRIEARLNLG
jgi:hypothetical protein